MQKISIIVPCYNEEQALPFYYQEMSRVMGGMTDVEFELLFVDDGSKDDTLAIIKDLAQRDGRVKYISFSRNFGKEAAIYAGLCESSGDYVCQMDADLQDPPALLPEMLNAITNEGFDCAATRRVTRKGEPPIRSFFARLFYKLMNRISDAELADGARDYRLMTRRFVDAVLSMHEYNRFSKGIFGWVGFKIKWIEFENVERVAGETKWSFWKLFLYSIEGITAFSTMPLAIATLLGVLLLIATLVLFIAAIVGSGSALWLATLITLVGGLQLVCTGIVGQYLAKTYLEVKDRPIYIIRDSNLDK